MTIPDLLRRLGPERGVETLQASLDGFRLGILICTIGELIFRLPLRPADHFATASVATIIALGLYLCAFPNGRIADFGLLLIWIALIVRGFPENANHHFLGLLALLLVVSHNRRSTERAHHRAALGAIRFCAAAVFFQSGLQKVFYGQYFQGAFLSFMVTFDLRFIQFFSVLSPEEVLRLAALEPMADGAGPFRFHDAKALLVNYATVLAELSVGTALLFRRLDSLTKPLSLLTLGAIEVVAREFLFGALLGVFLLSFSEVKSRKLAPVFAAASYLSFYVTRAAFPHVGFN